MKNAQPARATRLALKGESGHQTQPRVFSNGNCRRILTQLSQPGYFSRYMSKRTIRLVILLQTIHSYKVCHEQVKPGSPYGIHGATGSGVEICAYFDAT